MDDGPKVSGYTSIIEDEAAAKEDLLGILEDLEDAGITALVAEHRSRVYLLVQDDKVKFANDYLRSLSDAQHVGRFHLPSDQSN